MYIAVKMGSFQIKPNVINLKSTLINHFEFGLLFDQIHNIILIHNNKKLTKVHASFKIGYFYNYIKYMKRNYTLKSLKKYTLVCMVEKYLYLTSRYQIQELYEKIIKGM